MSDNAAPSSHHAGEPSHPGAVPAQPGSARLLLGKNSPATESGREHAVVLGAGMSGLFAARVISEFYTSVTIIERDTLIDQPTHRKGVPQDRHIHNFLGRGVQVLAELFPGILDEMGTAGAVVIDDGDLSRIYARMGRCELKSSGKVADPSSLTLCLASRPFVELYVRRRVAALPNVTILDGHDVLESLATGDAVTGVRIVNRANELTTVLDADLVIDATGRSARIPSLLERLGYGRPAEQRAPSAVGYSSQRFFLPDGGLEHQLVMSNRGPARPGALLLACEHQTWMLAVGRSIDDGGAPVDFATMLTLAQQVLPRAISEALRAARPLDEIAAFRNPAAVWRRYDQMPRFPRGLLVVGDALCSLNPIYGQGMTMAALQALTLRDCLRNGDTEMARRFFAGAARQIGSVWDSNQASERVPSPARARSLHQRLRSQTVKATLIAASHDTSVAERLLRVSHLIDPPARLTDPALLARVATANVRHLLARLRGPRRLLEPPRQAHAAAHH
jgi:2-polyprenyl-6-methoxyphenol hydroxylase-like FAD-dependent oxidoreductase